MKSRILTVSKLLSNGKLSAVELTESYLENIREKNSKINAFISVSSEYALGLAAAIDKKRQCGESLGPLAGIPFAVKDNICLAGIRTTCASHMLEDFVPPYTATAVSKLTELGAIPLGKTNMDEFAMGSASDTSVFGAVRNPLDTERTAGGSSGGSAAALAADMCCFALGSDTGGSARLPASFCGITAMKPTYGSVSRYGLVAFASSLEQICPMTASIYDNALILDAVCGRDQNDSTTVHRQAHSVPCTSDISKMKIAFPHDSLSVLNNDVSRETLRAVDALRLVGASIIDVPLPNIEAALAAYYVISSAEASSNLARYDGIRYGYMTKNAKSTDELFFGTRTDGFGDEVKKRLLLGTFCLSREGRDAYYRKSLSVKKYLLKHFNKIFDTCDAILLPVAPNTARRFDQKNIPSLDTWREDAFCVLANLTGLPSLSVPFGKDSNGLPIGVQIMGKEFSEKTLYRIGLALEEMRCEND